MKPAARPGPVVAGGCRPVLAQPYVQQARYSHVQRHFLSDRLASQSVSARGVPEVDRLSCCAFVFVDEAAEDVTAVELPRCG